jgi:hypothetical protein
VLDRCQKDLFIFFKVVKRTETGGEYVDIIAFKILFFLNIIYIIMIAFDQYIDLFCLWITKKKILLLEFKYSEIIPF